MDDQLKESHRAFGHSQLVDELGQINQRRANAKLAETDHNNTTGLALSGGGIRSATFNLGVLQALEYNKSLNKFDYLSSVSGGGYIASALSWFKSKRPKSFPFGKSRADHNQFGGQVISWIRAHSSFLTPGDGINATSLLTAILAGTLINLMIMIPVLVLLLELLSQPQGINIPYFAIISSNTGFDNLRLLGKSLLGFAFFIMILAALSTGISIKLKGKLTEHLRRIISISVSIAVVALAIGYIPSYHYYFDIIADSILHTSLSIAVGGIIISWFGAKSAMKHSSTFNAIIVNVGLIVTCLSFFIASYHLAKLWHEVPDALYGFLALSALLAIVCNINLVSMHGYYRNRLRDAFMPYKLPKDGECPEINIATWAESQQCFLTDLAKNTSSDSPYHIINCNIELSGSKQSKYRNRRGDGFIFSPLYCGSASTGYARTSTYHGGEMDLASACAISGAAVATNTSATSSKPLNFLMAMLNLRLGCWLPNPKTSQSKSTIFNKPWWYTYMFRDMFGRGLNENEAYIHLSDGGHFENLGVYELIRRQCKVIYAFDAGADPTYQFSDLAKLVELVRVDFGAKIAIDTSNIPPKADGISPENWAIGDIKYTDGTTGKLVYVKASIQEKLSEDIYGYKRKNPEFPHQSTADQFFDEAQFEAYRELGFQITHRLLKKQAV